MGGNGSKVKLGRARNGSKVKLGRAQGGGSGNVAGWFLVPPEAVEALREGEGSAVEALRSPPPPYNCPYASPTVPTSARPRVALLYEKCVRWERAEAPSRCRASRPLARTAARRQAAGTGSLSPSRTRRRRPIVGGTRRVRLVREEGRGVSSQYGREGGGEAPPAPRARSPPAPAGGGSARYKHHGSFSFTNTTVALALQISAPLPAAASARAVRPARFARRLPTHGAKGGGRTRARARVPGGRTRSEGRGVSD